MKTNIKKVLIGALIAASGAVLTYLTAWASGTDFGSYTPVVVAVLSVFANIVRKFTGA